jgi:hypothetical protein
MIPFPDYLKAQLTDFIDAYKKYFGKTFGIALTFTVLYFVAIAILLYCSNIEHAFDKQHVSLMGYFFNTYNKVLDFQIIDLSKIVFIFFVSIFSVAILRLPSDEENSKEEYSFISFIKKAGGKSILALTGLLLLCSAIEFGLQKLKAFILFTLLDNHDLSSWIYRILVQFEIFLPLILFSLAIFKLTTYTSLKISLKKIAFIYVSLWFFNEFAYEFFLFIRGDIFDVILLPAKVEMRFIYESFLGIPLIAFFFVGYFSAMTTSLKLLSTKENTPL